MRTQTKAAFSLVELMVVLGIIGLLATLGFPMVKSLHQGSAIASASRQLLDDISLARMKAINNRTTVYMVFAPTNPATQLQLMMKAGSPDFRALKQLTNLISGQFSAYALVAARTVGDQPGRPTPRYLTEWRSLPEGVFISPYKYAAMVSSAWSRLNTTNRPFLYQTLPFPTATSPVFLLPYVAFNSMGQVDRPFPTAGGPDEVIPLTRGSILFAKDALGRNTFDPPDFREVPPGNGTNMFNRVHIFWQTGRARVEKLEVR
jgi:prepilin-type N-terminal cleavage/methylation domain-containing protein